MTQDSLILLLIGLLLVVGILFRRWYLSLSKSYKVSEQYFPGIKLAIIEHDPRKETATIELELQSNQEIRYAYKIFLEFLQAKGERQRLSLTELDIVDVKTKLSKNRKTYSVAFEKRDLMRGIRNNNISLFRFRFAVELENQKIIKSHAYGFSSRYMLFRPDIGKFN